MPEQEEVVPGMAAAIERRRLEVGITLGEFADSAGVTRQGLAPVRAGYRRAYRERLKFGVARALQWPSDAVDRLMAGEDPGSFDDDPPPGAPAAVRPLRPDKTDKDEPIGLAALVDQLPPDKQAAIEQLVRTMLDK